MGLRLLRIQEVVSLVGKLVSTHGYFSVPLPGTPPDPGERCTAIHPCGRRVPKPRKSTSPTTRRIVAALPPDRAESLVDALDALQEVVGADATSYPRGTLLEAMLVVAGLHHREELIAFFTDYQDALAAQSETSGAA